MFGHENKFQANSLFLIFLYGVIFCQRLTFSWMTKMRGLAENILDLVDRDRNFDKFETSTNTYWSSGCSSTFVIISKHVLDYVLFRGPFSISITQQKKNLVYLLIFKGCLVSPKGYILKPLRIRWSDLST